MCLAIKVAYDWLCEKVAQGIAASDQVQQEDMDLCLRVQQVVHYYVQRAFANPTQHNITWYYMTWQGLNSGGYSDGRYAPQLEGKFVPMSRVGQHCW